MRMNLSKKEYCVSRYLLIVMISFGFAEYHVYSQKTWKLVWSDEFDYTGLPDSSKWVYDVGTGSNGWGNNELEYYPDRRIENASVGNGRLVINARKEYYEGKNYTSARIKTEGISSWMYGKIEARIRLPYGQGTWPAFWMLGDNIHSVGWPACGELDIMEMNGGTGKDNTTHGTAHWDDNGHQSSGSSKTLPSGIYADKFHAFSIEWDQWYIKWFVDGTLIHELSITSESMNAFHRKFFIILNLAVGGNWPGNPDGSTVFPQTMTIDYVRVYADSALLADVPSLPLSRNTTDRLHIYPNPASHKIFIQHGSE